MTREKAEKRNLKPKREPARLTGKLDAKLFSYAIAATAAGVGLAQVQPADAEVVAHPANISVPYNGGVVQFDINGDGQMDFGLSVGSEKGPRHRVRRQTCSTDCLGSFSSAKKVIPAQAANEIWQTKSKGGFVGNSVYCAAALGPGRRVGPAAFKGPGSRAMYWAYDGLAGDQVACPWDYGTNAYLGVKFLDIKGNVHYGWVRVSATYTSLTIIGYAYETTPNTPITTGVTHGEEAEALEPVAPAGLSAASLGWLALGAPGLAVWRRAGQEPAN